MREYLVSYYQGKYEPEKHMKYYMRLLSFKIAIGQLFLLAAIISFKDYPVTLDEFFTSIYEFKNAVGIFAVLIGNVLFYSADKIFMNIPEKSFMGGVGTFKTSSIAVSIIGFLFILFF